MSPDTTPSRQHVDTRIPTSRESLSIEKFTRQPERVPLGTRDIRFDIPSSLSPFDTAPNYKTEYPTVVKSALGELYAEYNDAFRPLVERNREWPTDYQYATDGNGNPINYFVQVDMTGLPTGLLENAAHHNTQVVKKSLKHGIFEIENSLAMYGLLSNLFPREGRPSQFKEQLDTTLDSIRERHGKKIALLAVTQEKHKAMRESEFGKNDGEVLEDDEVRRISGFDKFFGPEEFERHIRENGGKSDFILFVRSSEPVSKLRNPKLKVSVPLLEDDAMRKVIKANAITFNIDNPAWEPDDPRRINDTKAYLAPMGMALDVTEPDQVVTLSTDRQPQPVMGEPLRQYLIDSGYKPTEVNFKDIRLRAKPAISSYGCYGHAAGTITDKEFRQGLRTGMKHRGPYVLQPEIPIPTIVDTTDGTSHLYIDRNFFTIRLDNSGKPTTHFMGGFRSLMPTHTQEAKNGRVHGNGSTVWAEIK